MPSDHRTQETEAAVLTQRPFCFAKCGGLSEQEGNYEVESGNKSLIALVLFFVAARAVPANCVNSGMNAVQQTYPCAEGGKKVLAFPRAYQSLTVPVYSGGALSLAAWPRGNLV
jgi:hypothetical protein